MESLGGAGKPGSGSMAASSAANTAAIAAKKGLGMMFSASKVAAAAIQAGVQKARKGYANKHEQDVLNELKAKGLPPVEHLVTVLKRLYYLKMAGYKHELQAAALVSAKRLTDSEKTTVPIDVVVVLGGVLMEETLKYGEFQKSAIVQGMQDFLNKSRMGKDHYDRDSVAHDVYYAVLILAEEFDTEWEQLEACIRDAVTRLVEWAAVTEQSPDARTRAAKAVYRFAQAIKEAGTASEERRQKALKDAENTLRREQDRRRPPSFFQNHSTPTIVSAPAQVPITAPPATAVIHATSEVHATTFQAYDPSQNPYTPTAPVYPTSAPPYSSLPTKSA
ncbi:hypothetical protein MPTK1_7g09890 [Marchantia polymorpha subsp. ruderalis]|uniref:Uncharacterized protein n=3 Tax=Marchantia polymorpha TaxID=3197 RepID=A0AAF6BXX3_MARPO|nr:hypothetical protein MARPO_0003s0008 [Marchantia polymorpha]BBN16857.1 hypothetical protein Mp_7g09890 [Marchantia polymorpha subsp. ruderalis]|eukprot:PTQ49097.1 hypothetical protein MARPO_0003s0008 [Marchantia polymorpha]